jgi:hypothetical protein
MKNPSQRFNEQQQRWFDLITAAIKDDKESIIKLNQNEGVNRTNTSTNVMAIKSKNRISVVLAPAGRIPSSTGNNTPLSAEGSNRHSHSKDSYTMAEPREELRTTFYETTGRLSDLSLSSSAVNNATPITSNTLASTSAASVSVYDPHHVHAGHHHLDNFDHVT